MKLPDWLDRFRFWEPGSWRWAWQKDSTLPENWRDLSDHEKFPLIRKFGCLVCSDNPDFKVHEGPSGGMSQNVWCFACGTRWNIAVFPQDPKSGIAELVQERERDEEFNGR